MERIDAVAASQAMTSAVELEMLHRADPKVHTALVKLIAHAISEDLEIDEARATLIDNELRSYLDIAPLPVHLVPAVYGYEASNFNEIKFNDDGRILLEDLQQETITQDPIHCINRVRAPVTIPSRYLPAGRKNEEFNKILTRFKKGLDALNIRGNRLMKLDLAIKLFIPMSSSEERTIANYIHVSTPGEAQRVVQYVPLEKNPVYIQVEPV